MQGPLLRLLTTPPPSYGRGCIANPSNLSLTVGGLASDAPSHRWVSPARPTAQLECSGALLRIVQISLRIVLVPYKISVS